MELTETQLNQIHAALNQIQQILATPDPRTAVIDTWVHDHLHPAPGSRTLIQAARDQCRADTGLPITSRRLGRHVPYARLKNNSHSYYLDCILT